MPSVNTAVQSKAVQAAVDLTRYEASQRVAIRSMLQKLQKTLISEIANGKGTEFTKARLQSTLDAANAAIAGTYKDIRGEQAVRMTELALVQQRVAEGVINNSIGAVLIDTTFTPAQLKNIASNVLIEGAPSAEWWARAEKGTRERFADSIRQGMLRGDTIDQMVADVKDGVIVRSTREAESLVRTSVQTTANVIRQDVYKENADLFDGIQWVSTLDDRTTEICQALDGAQWTLDYEPIDDAPSYPGAIAHWGCRSTQVPILKSWSDLAQEAKGDPELAQKLDDIEAQNPGTRASMDGQVPDTLKYEDWLKDQSEEVQKDILGPGKWEVWDGGNGKLSLKDMIDQSGNPLTLAELEQRAQVAFAPSERTREFAYGLFGQGKKIEEVIDALKTQFPDEPNIRGIALIYRKEYRLIQAAKGEIKLPKPRTPTLPKPPAPLPTEKELYGDWTLKTRVTGGSPQFYNEALHRAPEQAREIVRQAQAMGLPVRNIRFTKDNYDFVSNGQNMRAAAWAEIHSTGDIVFPLDSIATRQVSHVSITTAHEVTHIRFQSVFNAYQAERESLFEWARDAGIGRSSLFTPGTQMIKPEIARHFRFIGALDRYLQDIKFMGIDDGTTTYSKGYWRDFFKGKASSEIAYHETLAEIAGVDRAAAQGIPHYRTNNPPSEAWRDFANQVNRLWDQTPIIRDQVGRAYASAFHDAFNRVPSFSASLKAAASI
jgi:SPP1 gp7 family putative phage head morphogenesis protein